MDGVIGEQVAAGADDSPNAAARQPGLRVAYVMSRFPKLSETFVLYEMLAVARSGVEVELFPLLRQREHVAHPEAEELAARAHYLPFLSTAILRSNLWFLRHRPRAYLRALRDALAGTARSANFLAGALGIFPKVAHAARTMESLGVAHVHCHFANHPALAGFLVHRLTGIPYSFTAHGSDLHVDRTMLARKVREAAFVVAISDYNRDLILEECGAQVAPAVRVVHCGVDTAVFSPPAERRSTGALRIVCVGTLHEVKGQTYLVEAVAALARTGIRVECELVGDGPDRKRLERRIAELSLEGTVRLAGSLPRPEVVRRVREADVIVAPSVPTAAGKREGIPVVLMEGLACGVPAVASRISGIPELVVDGETGLLVPPRDVDALAAALRRLAADPKLRDRLGRAGRARVVEQFDQERSAAALAGLFRAGAAG